MIGFRNFMSKLSNVSSALAIRTCKQRRV